jgi:transcriptional regulator GlxA family with amidase domain
MSTQPASTDRLTIAIALFDRVTMLDALGPYAVLADLPDSEVVFVAEQPGPVADSRGRLSVIAHAAYHDVMQPDVIVVPGGLATVEMSRRGVHPIIEWIRAVHPHTKLTTSVCTGAQLLGAAGLLDNVEATSHWFVRDDLSRFGAIPTESRMVRSGKIITAAGVSAGIDMALMLAAELRSPAVAQAIQLGIEYDPEPPFQAGNPRTAPAEILSMVSAAYAKAMPA